MAYRRTLNVVAVGAVGVCGWFFGAYQERQNLLKNLPLGDKFKSFPALPVFSTVSAASVVPFVEKSEVTHASRVGQIMRHGFPGLDNVRSFDDYVLSYDRRNRVAHWVFEHLHKDNVKPSEEVDRSKCEFTPDQSIHPYFR